MIPGEIEEPMKVLILGDGGHAKVVAQIMDAMDGLEPVGTLCKDTPSTGVTLFGLPVFSEADLFDIPHEAMVIALGDNRLRKKYLINIPVWML